jgi:nicotinamide-nucleotide amidase
LDEVGIPVTRKAVVGDDPDAIVRELDFAAISASIVLTTGGLGPTADDVTVAAVARWLNAPLRRDAAFVEQMRERFARRGIRMAPVNEKQADFIVGARVLENARGTAPGFWGRKDGTEVVVLPGVPSEMREIMEESVLPELSRRAAGIVLRRRVLRIGGMGESAVEQLIQPVYERWKDDPVTILASPGEVQLHLCARGTSADVEERLTAMERDFTDILGTRVFGRDEENLAAAVGRLLRDSGRTVAAAESCTGGMISEMLTEVPGSSAYFLGSVVSYANSAKTSLLGVSEETLARHGAVSDESAREMARGARERFGSDLAVAVSGIAGPDGGTEEKPVGTVFLALSSADGGEKSWKRGFGGDRETIRKAASHHALELLRRRLTGSES